MIEKVIVFGADGMLAQSVIPLLETKYSVEKSFHWEVDITNKEKLLSYVKSVKPQWILNLAAYTHVDGCETHREEAFKVNGEGAGHVAEAAKEVGARLIHISTDFIFHGTQQSPYTESDIPQPKSVYAISKYEGEKRVQQVLPKQSLIVRTSWLYGKGGNNFVKTILKLAGEQKELRVVQDQIGRPTYTVDLAYALMVLMELQAEGIVHFSNQGICSWYDFTVEILRLSGKNNVQLIPVTTEEFPRPATRPPYSVLSTEKYEKLTGKTIRPWQEALREYLKV